MRIIAKILAGLLITIVLIGFVVACLPRKITVERSLVVDVEIEPVFNQINDFKNWKNWMPWYDSTQVIFTALSVGKGASYSWNSGKESGTITIIESKKNKEIITETTSEKSTPTLGFWTFEQTMEGVKITWRVETSLSFPKNALGLFIDQFLGPELEKGLLNLSEFSQVNESN